MSQQSNPATLREALELAFYFAERHVPSKEGYCAKCGFCHCDRGHVLAMAKQGVLAALAASGTEAAPHDIPLCANHAESWYCERPSWPNPDTYCVVCALQPAQAAASPEAAPMSSNAFTVGPDGTSPYHVNNVRVHCQDCADPEGEGRKTQCDVDGCSKDAKHELLLADYCMSVCDAHKAEADSRTGAFALRQSAAPSGGAALVSKLRDLPVHKIGASNSSWDDVEPTEYVRLSDLNALLAQESK